MKARILLISTLAIVAATALASQSTPTGKSTLKLSDSVHETRKEIATIDKEIVEKEATLKQSRNQAVVDQSLKGTTSFRGATFQAQADALDLQIKDLKTRRAQLQDELNTQK